jgi:hypothetical protein
LSLFCRIFAEANTLIPNQLTISHESCHTVCCVHIHAMIQVSNHAFALSFPQVFQRKGVHQVNKKI